MNKSNQHLHMKNQFWDSFSLSADLKVLINMVFKLGLLNHIYFLLHYPDLKLYKKLKSFL